MRYIFYMGINLAIDHTIHTLFTYYTPVSNFYTHHFSFFTSTSTMGGPGMSMPLFS